jgi:hemerythrin superfamily protein
VQEPIDVIRMLEHDHQVIRDLARELDTVDDPVVVAGLYARIVEELLAHEEAEQELVFPALAAAPRSDTVPMLDRRVGEHDELNCMLREMKELDPSGFAFAKRGSALLLELEGHFEREEQTVFAQLRALVPEAELISMGERAAVIKQAARATE